MAKTHKRHPLVPAGAILVRPGPKHDIYEKPGGQAQADLDFDSIAGNHPVGNPRVGLRTCTLADGTDISVRSYSNAGPVTLQINPLRAFSGFPSKVRYVP